jgi:hypothetical protein
MELKVVVPSNHRRNPCFAELIGDCSIINCLYLIHTFIHDTPRLLFSLTIPATFASTV